MMPIAQYRARWVNVDHVSIDVVFRIDFSLTEGFSFVIMKRGAHNKPELIGRVRVDAVQCVGFVRECLTALVGGQRSFRPAYELSAWDALYPSLKAIFDKWES